MTESFGLSLRALSTAAMGASVFGAAVLVPVAPSGPMQSVSAAVQLSAAATPLLLQPSAALDAQAVAAATSAGSLVKQAYDAFEPWVAYGFELAQYALSWVPGLWWVAPGIDLAYFSIEPLVQAGVYVFADVISLDFAQIGPDIQQGIQDSVNNFVSYGLAWLNSLVPLPPIPPIPPLPGATVSAGPAASSAAARRTAVPAAATPVITDVAPVIPDVAVAPGIPDVAPAPADDADTSVPAVTPAEEIAVPAAIETPKPRRAQSRTASLPRPAATRNAPAAADASAPDGSEAPPPARAARTDRGR